MDVTDAVCLWTAYRRMDVKTKRKKGKKILSPSNFKNEAFFKSLYVTLHPKHGDKFFNYFRMSIKSFYDLLDIIKFD